MNQIALGDSGAQVSALCLGTMFFGTTVDQATSFRLLDRYYDAGGRFLDTADGTARRSNTMAWRIERARAIAGPARYQLGVTTSTPFWLAWMVQ